MSAPNIQVRNDPQVVTGGLSGTKLIGPTTVDGDLIVTGTISEGGGGGGGLAIAAAGQVVTDNTGAATILTDVVQTTSVILVQEANNIYAAPVNVGNIVHRSIIRCVNDVIRNWKS
jgi:hypothetical protein